MQESFVDLQLTLVTDSQPPEVVQPSQRALNYPAVPSQLFAALNPTSRNTRSDASFSQIVSTSSKVVPFIGVQLHWSLTSTPSSPAQPFWFLDRFDSIYNLDQHRAVMYIGARTDYRKRDPLSVDHNMALRARFSSIRRRRPGSLAPFLAGTLDESTEARVQSIFPASPNLSKSNWCNFSHTPVSCQSRRRRQQVIPLPQPISGGNISQGKPVLSTKMMPVRAARLGTRGRPPFGLDGSGGSSGSITCQSSSLTIGFAIPDSTGNGRF